MVERAKLHGKAYSGASKKKREAKANIKRNSKQQITSINNIKFSIPSFRLWIVLR